MYWHRVAAFLQALKYSKSCCHLSRRLILISIVVVIFCGLHVQSAFAEPKLSGSSHSFSNDVYLKPSLNAQISRPKVQSDGHVSMRKASKYAEAAQSSAAACFASSQDLFSTADVDLRPYAFLEPLDCLELDEKTYYTVKESCSLRRAASNWGVRLKHLLRLNPDLDLNSMLSEGQRVLVEDRTSVAEPYSRGKASRGSLRNGRIMPEGEGYFLRTYQPHCWGTTSTISAIVTALAYYAEVHPGAPLVNVGDLSKRRGGRLRPHASHQSGRDVDLGFVHKPDLQKKHPERFTKARTSNLDVEKTWTVIEGLIRTGHVEVIYIDDFVQKALYRYAKDRLTAQQIEAIFSFPRHTNSSRAMLQHWPGHRNHIHVRFRCPEGQRACRK